MPDASPAWGRFWLKAVLGLAITAALVVFLVRFIDPEQLSGMLSRTRLELCVAGLGLWLPLYAARTVRFKLLAPGVPWLTMFCIASVHNFLLRLLPMRTGELSWAFLVKRAGAAGLGESLLNLVLIRALDILCVLVFFCLALVFDSMSGQGIYTGDSETGLRIAAGAMVLVAALVLLMRRSLWLTVSLVDRALAALGLSSRPGVARTWQKVKGAAESFSRVRPRVVWLATAASLAVWVVMYGVFFVLMRALGLEVSPSQVVLGATGGVVSGFLPIGGIGSFGMLEAGWAVGFGLVGLGKSEAVSSGFSVSVITFAYAAIMAALAWPLLVWLGKKKS